MLAACVEAGHSGKLCVRRCRGTRRAPLESRPGTVRYGEVHLLTAAGNSAPAGTWRAPGGELEHILRD